MAGVLRLGFPPLLRSCGGALGDICAEWLLFGFPAITAAFGWHGLFGGPHLRGLDSPARQGLEDYLMTAVLRGVMAQRLVRRLCPHCRAQKHAAAELVRRFRLDRQADGPIMIWRAVGCEHCRQTGYRGRQAIADFLAPNEAIERLIFARAEQREIEREAWPPA